MAICSDFFSLDNFFLLNSAWCVSIDVQFFSDHEWRYQNIWRFRITDKKLKKKKKQDAPSTKYPRGSIPETMTLDVACDIPCWEHSISHATSRVIVWGIGPQRAVISLTDTREFIKYTINFFGYRHSWSLNNRTSIDMHQPRCGYPKKSIVFFIKFWRPALRIFLSWCGNTDSCIH